MWDELYKRVRTQWREVPVWTGQSYRIVRTGLDYGPVIAFIHALGWDLLEALDLLRAIELEMLIADQADE